MTYLELLGLIEERKETTLAQDIRSIITDKHRYIRDINWQEDTEEGYPDKRYDRSGVKYVWQVGKPTEEGTNTQ